MSRRRWARWTAMDLEDDLRAQIQMARAEGMLCIAGSRPGLCCWNSIALYGTSEQMRRTEARWEAAGIEWHNRQPRGAWSAGMDRPRAKWDEERYFGAAPCGEGEGR